LLIFIQFSWSQDWPNLMRFKEDNAKLMNLETMESRVVFMGNSITEHWRSVFFDNHPNYVNRGISGQTTPQMLLRFKQDVIDLDPAVVVILAGINDIAGNTGFASLKMIEDNITSMIELAKAHGIDVVLCSVLPANKFPWAPKIEPAQKVIDLNHKLSAYAKANNVVYVDYFSATVNELNGLKASYGDDGMLPNDLGYSVMEPLVELGISKALSSKE